MENARDTKRLRKRLTMKFGIEVPSRVAFTEDISLQGMCIKTAMVCPPGSRLKIELSLPDGNVAKMAGVVMWAKKVPPNMVHLVKKCGMGVRITGIDSGEEGYVKLCDDLHAK
jgi:hypothetical protein